MLDHLPQMRPAAGDDATRHSTTQTVLDIRDLSVRLPRGADRKHAVRNVNLSVGRGEILCVVGESGSGKSVLSAAVMRHLPRGLTIESGSLMFGGQDLRGLSRRRMQAIRGKRISMIFQEPMASLNPAMTVGAQIEEVFQVHTSLPRAERRERTLSLLADMHLPDPQRIHRSYPHALSGGQCQRVIIAMALALKPDLLIADEPTTALDVTTQAQILKLILKMRDRYDNGVIFITHDFGVVADIADRIAVMQDGEVVEIGDAADVLNRPRHPYTKALIDAVPDMAPHRPPLEPPAPDEPVALRVEGLTKTFGSADRVVKAVADVSLSLRRGETLGVVGESGSGKSTLARCIIRLERPTGGRIDVHGQDFAALSPGELRTARGQIQMVFQDPFGSLNPKHSVGSIIARGPMVHGMPRDQAWEKAETLLELVGLQREAAHRRPHQFSGGQRQRIGIARALALDPELLICDESVSALDVSVQKQVLELLQDLQERLGIAILFITHDLRVAAQISDWIAVMRQGELVEFDTARRIFEAPRHDYTRTLLASAPGRRLPGQRL